MRKFNRIAVALLLGFGMLFGSSCATVFSGRLTEHQKTKPAPGEQKREVKWELVAVDALLFFPIGLLGIPIDFATGAIYRPLRDNYGRKVYEKEKQDTEAVDTSMKEEVPE